MAHTSTRRSDPANITPQEEVVLGILDSEPDGVTSAEVAEALKIAQEFLPPRERIRGDISPRSAGQYLGFLRTRGLARCEPDAGVPLRYNRDRVWYKR